MENQVKYFEGVGRRKTSSARVRIFKGDAVSTVNDKPAEEYFAGTPLAKRVYRPLDVCNLSKEYYFSAKVEGGGTMGQLDAVSLGLARALYEMDSTLKTTLRKNDLITRDPRMVERKKYNHIKSRKKPQFSKR